MAAGGQQDESVIVSVCGGICRSVGRQPGGHVHRLASGLVVSEYVIFVLALVEAAILAGA